MKLVTVTMPLEMTAEQIRAVREDPTTKAEDWETWHTRLGWLICAWDVLVRSRPPVTDYVMVPRDALEWLLGERGEFEPSDAHPPTRTGLQTPGVLVARRIQEACGPVTPNVSEVCT